MGPLFRLESIRMAYGEKTALSVPALDILEGRVTVLSGPNGSGKSTLLSLLAFLAAPSSGTLWYDGRPVRWRERDLVRLRREAVLMHQAPYLFDETVAANVGFGLAVRGVGAPEREPRVAEALEAVGLPGFGRRRARELSGGEAQRVAMARVLALSPRVMLFDEPLANVDRETAELIDGLIASLARRGVTVVLATHDAAQAGRIATDVVCLAGGGVDGRTLSGGADFGHNGGNAYPDGRRDARI